MKFKAEVEEECGRMIIVLQFYSGENFDRVADFKEFGGREVIVKGRLFASYVGYLMVNEHFSFHISVMEENGEGLKI